jgi:hypothetical protein
VRSVDGSHQAVDLALRHLAGQPMTRADALAMRGMVDCSDRRGGLADARKHPGGRCRPRRVAGVMGIELDTA